ncbi:MAG: tetratricopeptide repeat protein [Nanoarchaeota archaeon]
MGLFDYFRKKETELPKELVPVFATMHKARLGRKLADEALSHRNINNFDKALSLLKESLEKYDYIPAMSLISTTLILNEQYIEAIKWINNCLKNLNEENSYIKIELLANLGLIYYSKFKDYKKALEIYLESLSIPKPSNISDEAECVNGN